MNNNTIKRQIIAIGGGGFGRDAKHTKIEKYILDQTKKDNPHVLFLPTASAVLDGKVQGVVVQATKEISFSPENIKEDFSSSTILNIATAEVSFTSR